MAPVSLETEDHSRDAAFNRAMHGKSAGERAGFMSMLKKDPNSQKAAVDEYFKHWDNQAAGTETQEIRAVGYWHVVLHMRLEKLTGIVIQARKAEYATLTRQYVI